MQLQKKRSRVFNFRISKDLDEKLTSVAAKEEVTKAELIRFSITNQLKKY